MLQPAGEYPEVRFAREMAQATARLRNPTPEQREADDKRRALALGRAHVRLLDEYGRAVVVRVRAELDPSDHPRDIQRAAYRLRQLWTEEQLSPSW